MAKILCKQFNVSRKEKPVFSYIDFLVQVNTISKPEIVRLRKVIQETIRHKKKRYKLDPSGPLEFTVNTPKVYSSKETYCKRFQK